MSETEPIIKRPRGRPKTLTLSDKKRKKSECDSKRSKSRINIGSEFDRWNSLKEQLSLNSHTEMAKLLLDSYENQSDSTTVPKDFEAGGGRKQDDVQAVTSTPAAHTVKYKYDKNTVFLF